MPYRVEIVEGPQVGESYPVDSARGTIVGRSPTNNVYLKDRSVSRAHCQIRAEAGNGRCFIEDLGSTNGTFVNGQRVTEAELRDGDIIRLGAYQVKVVRYEDTGTDSTTMLDEEGEGSPATG